MDTITANGDKPESEQKGAEGKPIKKSRLKTMYIYRPVKNAAAIIKWAKEQGFAKAVTSADMHVTIAFSKNPVDWDLIPLKDNELTINTSGRDVIPLGNTGAVVLRFNSEKLQKRWKEICEAGASWDNEDYKPHATITFDGSNMNLEGVIPYDGEIILGPEKRNVLNEDWAADITEKMQKAILTQNNHKTWADDRGYSQPFIWNNVISGTGQVIKPPVAVNLQSQTLEIELTAELAAKGLNVKPVVKMSYVEVVNMLRGKPDVFFEFEKYVNMTPEYDSEKWRSKLGGSRKFAYYLVSDYIDGYALNNPLLIADMKRDTESYEQAARDLARLCKTEKDMVLGDRRPDQYIIGNDKRAYGLDYQFEGDFDRWNNTKDSIKDVLVMIPELLDVFKNELNKKGIKETIKSWRR